MTTSVAAQAALDLAPPTPLIDRPKAESLRAAALHLMGFLARGQQVDAHVLRSAMETAFGASDSAGAWGWKDAYEAVEAAQVLFLRRYLPAMRRRAASSRQLLDMVAKLAALTPTHTRRSEESQALQQFSTPLEMGLAVSLAAAIQPSDRVLEPSAGTGQLAVFAEAAGASLILNEIAETRADLLGLLFPDAKPTRFNAEHIHDLLPDALVPTVVVMNPPFSASPNVKGTLAGTDLRHLKSALSRLAPGGRLVAVTSHGLSPDNPRHANAFEGLHPTARVVFTAPLAGSLYARKGTTFETRLTVIDKHPDPIARVSAGACWPTIDSAQQLIDHVATFVPTRLPLAAAPATILAPRPSIFALTTPVARPLPLPARPSIPADPGVPLSYTLIDTPEDTTHHGSGDAIYEPYAVQTIRIEGAKPHPTPLVQSAAMASVRPPKPSHRPLLPARVVSDGLLTDIQLESVIYAGDAHAGHIPGRWLVNDTLDKLTAAADDNPKSVQFRRGWFLGDGTGVGKGRQIAGILLDNWLNGRRRALWISKSSTLIEDAQRDWQALGQEKLLIVPHDRFKQGTPIRLHEGILFTTYATLRSAERQGKASRLAQIVEWLKADPSAPPGSGFDGVIVFDEGHAMANAGAIASERGDKKPSLQGLAGLQLQHALPDARVVYVSATGATSVENLAYAQRLGLWGGSDFPFPTRAEFVSAMQQGGVAAMEVLARDLKSLGLYAARALSYAGVEVDMLEHQLTQEQIRIYDSYARAYQVIHRNLGEALNAAGVTGEEGATLNRNAKSAALSAFYSTQQRFFAHLITSFKMPTLIRDITDQLAAGHAAVVQIVTTSEALMERRLAQIPAAEWNDLSVDVTPREYVLDYLQHGFPTVLYETYTDDDGNLCSRPVFDKDGNPVVCKEAAAARDRMIEHLAALPPVQAALDQLIHHFGHEAVAEVTGRGRRIIRKVTGTGAVLCVANRPASSNFSETQSFMDDKKRILVFSDAGGTGRSYHADLGCLNTRLRIHYLLEGGWKADTAVQGLGRSNRTNQAQPPRFRPVATDVRGEKRFLSTIARRLDTLGAITRGQRQTGGQGLFRPEDNLESPYARAALRSFYWQIVNGKVAVCGLQRFQEVTGLNLLDADGTLKEELPPITTFLNRVLALEIGMQNAIFEHFEGLLTAEVEGAIAKGVYDMGLETIRADSLRVTARQTIATHAASGAVTQLFTVAEKSRTKPLTLDAVLGMVGLKGILLGNAKSGRAALQVPAASWTLQDGSVQKRVTLIRPMERSGYAVDDIAESSWEPVEEDTFARLWTQEVDAVPEFTEKTFHMVTGLLLPIWKRLPADHPRVYRFTADNGERVIGRYLPPDQLGVFTEAAPTLGPDQAFQALLEGRPVPLDGGRLTLKRVRSMHAPRIELVGFTDTELDRLKAAGCVSEIISWTTRLFVPIDQGGPRVIARLMAAYPAYAVAA